MTDVLTQDAASAPSAASPSRVELSTKPSQSYGQLVKAELLRRGLSSKTNYQTFLEPALEDFLERNAGSEGGLSLSHLKVGSGIVHQMMRDVADGTDLPVLVEIAGQPTTEGGDERVLNMVFRISKSQTDKSEVRWINHMNEDLLTPNPKDDADLWARTATFGVSHLGNVELGTWTKMTDAVGSDIREVCDEYLEAFNGPPELKSRMEHGSGTCGGFGWRSSVGPDVEARRVWEASRPGSIRYNLSLSHNSCVARPLFQAASCTTS